MRKIWLFALALIFISVFVQAVSIESVKVDTLEPGESGKITIDVENKFEDVAKNVVFDIDVSDTIFNVVGSSSFAVSRLRENEDERFAFEIRVSPTAKPGEYQIPYKLSYKIGNELFLRESSIGVKVSAESIVDFSADVDKPVIKSKSKIDFNIINKGLGELRFVSVKIIPDGFTLLSEQQIHIGDVDSDDFEIASFDVIFTKEDASAKAIVEYRDSENKLYLQTIELPLEIYSREKALELGIISESNTPKYMIVIFILFILWFGVRAIRKRRRMKKSQGG